MEEITRELVEGFSDSALIAFVVKNEIKTEAKTKEGTVNAVLRHFNVVEPVAEKTDEAPEDKVPESELGLFIDMLDGVVIGIQTEAKDNNHPKLAVAVAHARSCRDRLKEVVGV